MRISAENTHISAGGVVYRRSQGQTEIALILVAPHMRWQLPKGTINPGESNEEAARREVREETGLNAEVGGLLDRVEYRFVIRRAGKSVRVHKFVYFYLMPYQSGDVADHDHEAVEARWFEIHQALEVLAFESDKGVVRAALQRLNSLEPGPQN